MIAMTTSGAMFITSTLNIYNRVIVFFSHHFLVLVALPVSFMFALFVHFNMQAPT